MPAFLMAEGLPCTYRVTLGADKGRDAHDFITELRHMDITSHIAQNDTNHRSATDGGGSASGEFPKTNRRDCVHCCVIRSCETSLALGPSYGLSFSSTLGFWFQRPRL